MLKKRHNKEELLKILEISNKVKELNIELWDLAMKNYIMGSKEYKRICASGNASQKVLDDIWFCLDDSQALPTDELDKLAPKFRTNCCFG